jgi:acetyl-CoA carboxylase carboxyltransferase component
MMERSSVELSRFKVNISIITTAEEAYPREKVAVKNSNNKNNDDNKKKEELARLEKVAKLLEIGSSKFMEAMSSNSNDGKRKELLEQAFQAYVDIVPYLGKMPYLTVPVLQQIKNIEKLMEMEIEKSVNADDGTSINIDEVMKVARKSLL